MTSLPSILFCAIVAMVCFTAIGLPFARRVVPAVPGLFVAPALGWAIQSAAALPVFFILDFSRNAVAIALIAPSIMAIVIEAMSGSRVRLPKAGLSIFGLAVAASAILALVAMAGVLPQVAPESVILSGPIFDHSKVAMIDEMVRVGVPPANPFYGAAGQPLRLSYYYLWHFSAAELALLTGASSWEADAALTWFTAFASLLMMGGLAAWLSGRSTATLIVVALAATGALRPIVYWLGWDNASEYLGYASGFGGWLFQTSWAPQHTASAMSAVLTLILVAQLSRQWSIAAFIALVLTMVASFQSSTWIGAFFLPPAAALVSIMLLAQAEPARRLPILLSLAGAALIAVVMIAPFLRDQIAASIVRGGGSPVALVPYKVLGDITLGSETLRAILNLPAFWLIFLLVEWPAFYLAGLAGLRAMLRGEAAKPARNEVMALAIAAAVSLIVAWLLASVVGDNNDLGWRAALPALMILIVSAAIGISHWIDRRMKLAVIGSAALIALGLPDAILIARGNISPKPNASDFAGSAALWEAVRSHAGPRDRVANNSLFLEQATPWPVNISWALLSNRRSCYPGPELTRPFAAISRDKLIEVDALFTRIFAGNSTPDDDRRIATQFDCKIVVVTPHDGAWSRPPFASGEYRIVEEKPRWRIYARTN